MVLCEYKSSSITNVTIISLLCAVYYVRTKTSTTADWRHVENSFRFQKYHLKKKHTHKQRLNLLCSSRGNRMYANTSSERLNAEPVCLFALKLRHFSINKTLIRSFINNRHDTEPRVMRIVTSDKPRQLWKDFPQRSVIKINISNTINCWFLQEKQKPGVWTVINFTPFCWYCWD